MKGKKSSFVKDREKLHDLGDELIYFVQKSNATDKNKKNVIQQIKEYMHYYDTAEEIGWAIVKASYKKV